MMSRIRTIKPEFWTSEQIMECSPLARLAFIGMWNFCDDRGVHPASCKTLKAEVLPGDDITTANVQTLVNELLQNGLVAEFHADGRNWWFVTGWHHQLINRPTKSRYPLPPRHAPLPKAAGPDDDQDERQESNAMQGTLTEDSLQMQGTLTEDSLQMQGALTEDSLQMQGALTTGREGKGRERKGRERKGKEGNTAPARNARTPSAKTTFPPDFSITPELRAWAAEQGYSNLKTHLDHFRDKATSRGYQYADWNAAFRNAVRDDWAGLRNRSPPTATPTTRNNRTQPLREPATDPTTYQQANGFATELEIVT